MASSRQKPRQLNLLDPYGATATPPPTPSVQPDLSSATVNSEILSQILHRLPPSLSLSPSTRRRSSSTTTSPLVSLSDGTPALRAALRSAAVQHGFFHLDGHTVPSDLRRSSESAAVSLFNLPVSEKHLLFPSNWPIGYDTGDGEEDGGGLSEAFCIDRSCSGERFNAQSGLNLGPLHEFGLEMEKLGLNVMDDLAAVAGFSNPARDDPSSVCSLLWISKGENKVGRVYPYVIGLHWRARSEYSLLSDSGRVNGSYQADRFLVTLGDITQVWSNGVFKKIKGRPITPSVEAAAAAAAGGGSCITISLLITLPIGSTVSPLNSSPAVDAAGEQAGEDGDRRLFRSFSFEDYAWRIYNQDAIHLSNDPLSIFRITDD